MKYANSKMLAGREFTLRRSGAHRYTATVKIYIPAEMVEWIVEHTDLSERQAFDWIKENDHALRDDWTALAVTAAGQPCTIPTDDVLSVLKAIEAGEGDEVHGIVAVYEGTEL